MKLASAMVPMDCGAVLPGKVPITVPSAEMVTFGRVGGHGDAAIGRGRPWSHHAALVVTWNEPSRV
jgi:hypothetical protein